MCGIFGYKSKSFQPEDFFNLMKHRGPDSQGYQKSDKWIFGHLRLSILDLSDTANQPFQKDNSLIVFNGEIFNYLEIKEKYLKDEKFITTSDTEILINLLVKYGIESLNLLNGMFALAFKDPEGSIFLVRDRFGIKPLYYTKTNKGFAFSSEINPLLNLQRDKRIDDETLKNYFSNTATDYDFRSGYKNIYSLEAGHYLKIDSSKEEKFKWYKDKKIFQYKNTISLKDECEKILLDSIKIRCRSDVPLAITLSGGIDSTLIYTLIKEKTSYKVKPFIFKHSSKETDESQLAINLCNKYNDNPFIIEERDSSLDELKLSMDHLELPIWSASSAGFFLMYRKISEYGYKVVIEGHGSDEQLGGYPYMIQSALNESIRSLDYFRTYDLVKTFFQTLNPNLGEKSSLKRKLKFIARTFLNSLLNKNSFQDELDYAFSYKILPIVLRTFDRMSMANSIESRMPFLDYRFVEFIKHLPSKEKVNKLGSKAILRELLLKYKNNEVALNRKKMGFSSDLSRLLNQKEVLKFLSDLACSLENTYLQKEKSRALSILSESNLNWENSSIVWKVASASYYIEKLKKSNRGNLKKIF